MGYLRLHAQCETSSTYKAERLKIARMTKGVGHGNDSGKNMGNVYSEGWGLIQVLAEFISALYD